MTKPKFQFSHFQEFGNFGSNGTFRSNDISVKSLSEFCNFGLVLSGVLTFRFSHFQEFCKFDLVLSVVLEF